MDLVHGGCTNWANGTATSINQKYEYYIGDNPAFVFNKLRGLTFSKLFKTEIINSWKEGQPLRFDEKMKIAEDLAFTLDYILAIKRYAFVPEVGYYYRIDNLNSATHTSNCDYPRGLHEYLHQYQSTINYILAKHLSKEEAKYRLGLMGRELFAKQRILYENKYKCNECYRHILEDFTDEQRKLLGYWNFSGWQRPLALLQYKGYLRLYNFIMYILFKTQKLLSK